MLFNDDGTRAVRDQITQLRATIDASNAATAASRAHRLQTEARDNLKRAGVASHAIEHAMTWLQSHGRLAYADEGEGETMVFKKNEREEPLEQGLKAWAKSREASLYMPPVAPIREPVIPASSGLATRAPNPYADVEDLLVQHARGELPSASRELLVKVHGPDLAYAAERGVTR